MVNEDNGPALPPAREAAFAEGLRVHQEIASERDNLLKEVAQLKVELQGREQSINSLQDMMNVMESRIATSTLARDQAVADRAVFETLFISIKSLFNAFAIPSAPLVRDRTEDAAHEDAYAAMQHVASQRPATVYSDLINTGRSPVPQSGRGPESPPPLISALDNEQRQAVLEHQIESDLYTPTERKRGR